MNFDYKRFAEERPPKKISQKEEYNNVEIKNKEKIYFESVFKELCALEKEPSSEDSKEKKMQRQLEKHNKTKKTSNQKKKIE